MSPQSGEGLRFGRDYVPLSFLSFKIGSLPSGFQFPNNPCALLSNLQEVLHLGGLTKHRAHVPTVYDHSARLGGRSLTAKQINLDDTSMGEANHPKQLAVHELVGKQLKHTKNPFHGQRKYNREHCGLTNASAELM